MGMFDMLGKLGELKKSMEAAKARLDAVMVEGASGNNRIRVTMTANQQVKEIRIDPELLNSNSKEELEELLAVAFNKATINAKNVSETEMKAAGKGLLPDIPGLL
jgi:DNA-binding YbaB/EbfC family protein